VPKYLMLDLDENNDHFEFDILPVAYIPVYLEYVSHDLKLEKKKFKYFHLQMVLKPMLD
jgi:hypothetical protein